MIASCDWQGVQHSNVTLVQHSKGTLRTQEHAIPGIKAAGQVQHINQALGDVGSGLHDGMADSELFKHVEVTKQLAELLGVANADQVCIAAIMRHLVVHDIVPPFKGRSITSYCALVSKYFSRYSLLGLHLTGGGSSREGSLAFEEIR